MIVDGIKDFSLIFLSVLMQALPFMLVGVFVSAFLEVFISNEVIVKLFPTKYGLGFITALFGGLFFPVCECAIVPVTVRLIKKGVSLPIAITFMLSAPIINPIVIVSTLYAFPNYREVTLYRVLFGLIIAFIVGLVLILLDRGRNLSQLKEDILGHDESSCTCGHHHDESSCACGHHHAIEGKATIWKKLRTMFLHIGEEFFDVGKFLILGIFFSSLIQEFIPSSLFKELDSLGISLLIMMVTAFLFSVCSTSDAFIARTFTRSFSNRSIMGFLVYGPMMDVKNIFILAANFKKKFVLLLFALVGLVSYVGLYILTRLFM